MNTSTFVSISSSDLDLVTGGGAGGIAKAGKAAWEGAKTAGKWIGKASEGINALQSVKDAGSSLWEAGKSVWGSGTKEDKK